MDIAAHALWAAAGGVWGLRRRIIDRAELAATVALAVLPDMVQFLPLIAWVMLGTGSWHTLAAFALALPGHEPDLPHWVAHIAHQLHCFLHSGVIAGIATLTLSIGFGRMWWPLLGWWSHIAIDLFTHSSGYYPVPVFFPLNDWSFEGIAWTQPWMLAGNYLALMVTWGLIWRSRPSRDEHPSACTDADQGAPHGAP